eukprot:520775-Amphidinium_carterae.1
MPWRDVALEEDLVTVFCKIENPPPKELPVPKPSPTAASFASSTGLACTDAGENPLGRLGGTGDARSGGSLSASV